MFETDSGLISYPHEKEFLVRVLRYCPFVCLGHSLTQIVIAGVWFNSRIFSLVFRLKEPLELGLVQSFGIPNEIAILFIPHAGHRHYVTCRT